MGPVIQTFRSDSRQQKVVLVASNFTIKLSVIAAIALTGVLTACSGCQNAASDAPAASFAKARRLVHQGEFARANDALETFIGNHKGHRLVGRAKFLSAKCRLGMGEFDMARQQFNRVVEQFPGTEESNKAAFKIAMIDLMEGKRDEAQRRIGELAEAADGPYTPEAAAWTRVLAEPAVELQP